LGICVILLAGCTGGGGGSDPVVTTIGVGSVAPEIAAGKWYNSGDQPVTLTAQKEAGKPVVLSFCRSDCHVCKGQMPALVGLYNQHKDKAVFITLSDEETGPIEKCLQDFAAVQWAVGAKSETYKAYDVEYVPTYVLIDKSGTIRHMGHYAVDGATDVDDLETAIEEFVK